MESLWISCWLRHQLPFTIHSRTGSQATTLLSGLSGSSILTGNIQAIIFFFLLKGNIEKKKQNQDFNLKEKKKNAINDNDYSKFETFFFIFLKCSQPYWNYREQTSYLTNDERHAARQSIDAASQPTFDSPSYAASTLRSYENYSASGKSSIHISQSFIIWKFSFWLEKKKLKKKILILVVDEWLNHMLTIFAYAKNRLFRLKFNWRNEKKHHNWIGTSFVQECVSSVYLCESEWIVVIAHIFILLHIVCRLVTAFEVFAECEQILPMLYGKKFYGHIIAQWNNR